MKSILTILFFLFALATSAQVQEVICSEYRADYLKDGTAWAQRWITGTGSKVVPYNGGHQFVEGKGALYNIIYRKATGEVYLNNPNTLNLQLLQYDTLGIPFKAIALAARMQTYYAIRQDGTIWTCGSKTRWVKLSGQSVRFKAIDKGTQLVALAEDGTVYTLADGSATWTKKILPAPTERIFASGNSFYIALVDGQPYGWGQTKYLTGVTGTITNPIALKDHWNIGEHRITDLAVNENTIHYILDDNTLWGMGNNIQGEVGNGWELVNKAEYKGIRYVGSWESPTSTTYPQVAFVSKPVHIRPAVKFKRVYGGGTYAFYWYALDVDGNLYSWGRNKASVLGNGMAISNESVYPNFGDIVVPTVVNPFAMVIAMPYEFVPGAISAGKDTAVIGPAFVLFGNATPSRSKNFSYKIIAWKWAQLSGLPCPVEQNSVLYGCNVKDAKAGKYAFQIVTTDDQGGTMADTVVVTVTIPNKPPVVDIFCSKVVIGNSIILAVKATDPDGKVVQTEWDKINGPTDSLTDIAKDVVQITFTSSGEYTYRFSAFDDIGATTTVDITLIVYQTGTDSYIIIRKT